MRVTLLHNTPLWVCSRAIRTCWDSHDKSDTKTHTGTTLQDLVSKNLAWYKDPKCGEEDKELIERVGNKNKHSSTLEHLVYSFEIDGISRACLQELARHRMASLSVKSSRYTLRKLKDVDFGIRWSGDGKRVTHSNKENLEKFFVKNQYWDDGFYHLVELIQRELRKGTSSDVVKYMLPECFKTRLVWTINARSLQNFLALRTSKSALLEIRELAYNVFKAIPEDHKYLFENFLADLTNIK